MQFVDMQVYASDMLDDPNNGYFTLSILKQRLNLAYRELQKRLISANEEYYTTCVKTNLVVGQNAYALPSDFMQIIRLEYVIGGSGTTADTQQIMYMSPNQRNLVVDRQGDPGYYYFQHNSVILVPTPNTARELHLEYSYYVQDMVADTDVPDAPAQFHEYIPILAVRDCLIKDGRGLEAISEKMNQYERLLKEVAEQRRADSPRMIVQTSQMDWY